MSGPHRLGHPCCHVCTLRVAIAPLIGAITSVTATPAFPSTAALKPHNVEAIAATSHSFF